MSETIESKNYCFCFWLLKQLLSYFVNPSSFVHANAEKDAGLSEVSIIYESHKPGGCLRIKHGFIYILRANFCNFVGEFSLEDSKDNPSDCKTPR
jgi:hypothetical protein